MLCLFLLGYIIVSTTPTPPPPPPRDGIALFRKGDMGYDSFRGTVLLQEVGTPWLIAFACGRKGGGDASGRTLFVRRSSDAGTSWDMPRVWARVQCSLLDRILHSRLLFGSHACSLEANVRVINSMPLGSPLFLVDIANYVAPMKAPTTLTTTLTITLTRNHQFRRNAEGCQ
jgi:hypothetical protein